MSIPEQDRDDVLLHRAAKGDQESLLCSIGRHQAALYRFALRMTAIPGLRGSSARLFMTLMREPKKYDASRGPVGAYLLHPRIAYEAPGAAAAGAFAGRIEWKWARANESASIDLHRCHWPSSRSEARRVRAAVLDLPAEFREAVFCANWKS